MDRILLLLLLCVSWSPLPVSLPALLGPSLRWMRSWGRLLWRILSLPGKMTSSLAWLLLLVLRNSLSELAAHIPPPGFRYASYEVTIPRKLISRYGQRKPQEVLYLLQIEGEGLVVHLRQKRGFVPKHFPVFTYNKAGGLQVDYPFIRDDCFYHGFVQDKLSSLAALSTCSGGLRGLLQVDSKTYEIEPVQASAAFQHVVYRLEEEKSSARMSCGLTEEERSHQEAMIQNPDDVGGNRYSDRLWRTYTKYAKVAIVVDHERYIRFGKNETLTIMQVLDTINFADSFYQPLGIRVIMVGLEIWSQKNLITIAKSIDELLDVFNTWRKMSLVQRLKHDVGHLLVYKHFGVQVGLSFVGTVCDPIWASAVEVFITSSSFSFAITFAHQLGHNLGMQHDEKYCTCNQPSCIMAALQSGTSKFSNCSYGSYFSQMNRSRKQCLLIPPEHEKLYELKNCGNKVVESGEQCDCGSDFHCESDACCQSNCMLRSGANCAFGKCCSNCQFLPAGTICRERMNICDLPEYCTGISEWCPEDVYVQDGAPCLAGAYCYHGKCSTHNEQCKMAFGKQAVVAPLSCFKEINTQGDRFGNCGMIRGSVYKKCESSHVLCGRVQCSNVMEVPTLTERSTVIQTSVNGNLCWGTNSPSETGAADPGAVRDGTPCGNGMICINQDCIQVSLLNYDCNQTKCHNRGICNSHKNCHCHEGWAPPYCLDEGDGGSIDSGPPPPNSGHAGMAASVGLVLLCFCCCCSWGWSWLTRSSTDGIVL
ncbi:disintegrin and metalloproteinase domain-containing protein 20-like [Hemicordylus capensis]|uniref:disintegrin and metalloproteinase domain-containing protein 20-like n=1 Tax=Hemicordylus capensis TaxID=884348 RepID=UPI002302FE11|nr:disintegrin and metalloproteinase domain-containing protein 20-like [Hemicordylus capensis]